MSDGDLLAAWFGRKKDEDAGPRRWGIGGRSSAHGRRRGTSSGTLVGSARWRAGRGLPAGCGIGNAAAGLDEFLAKGVLEFIEENPVPPRRGGGVVMGWADGYSDNRSRYLLDSGLGGVQEEPTSGAWGFIPSFVER